jgi:hypothetical protein
LAFGIHSRLIVHAVLCAACSLAVFNFSAGIAAADNGESTKGPFTGDGDNGQGRRFFEPGSVVISASTYDRTQGAVASFAVGTLLPDTATKTTVAVTGNNYVTVWNNASVDASFGVTSPIICSISTGTAGASCMR